MAAITEPGIYDVSDRDYLADPVAVPSLNNTIARLIVDQSPAHAFAEHPRLGAGNGARSTPAMDVGTAAHELFLRGETATIVRLPHTEYRTAEARGARDEVLASGRIPLKPLEYEQVIRVVDALERKVRGRDGAFVNGKPEQTIVWTHGSAWCRCKPDWLPDDPSLPLWDLKTTARDARAWERNAFENYGTQAVWYARGAECVRGEPPNGMVFVVIETSPPYEACCYQLDPIGLEIAEGRISLALDLWQRCQAADDWPGYPFDVEWISPPAWTIHAWESLRARRGLQPLGDVTTRIIDKMVSAGNMGG